MYSSRDKTIYVCKWSSNTVRGNSSSRFLYQKETRVSRQGGSLLVSSLNKSETLAWRIVPSDGMPNQPPDNTPTPSTISYARNFHSFVFFPFTQTVHVSIMRIELYVHKHTAKREKKKIDSHAHTHRRNNFYYKNLTKQITNWSFWPRLVVLMLNVLSAIET